MWNNFLYSLCIKSALVIFQILIWWFNTKISASHTSNGGHSLRGGQNSSSSSQHAASSLCDEIVALWRLCALDPAFSPMQRDDLQTQFKDWHMHTIDKVRKARGNTVPGGNNTIKKSDIEVFTGFKSSIEATQLDWSDYVIPGITYIERHRPYSKYYLVGLAGSRAQDAECRKASRTKAGQISATQVSCGLVKAITSAAAHRRHTSLRAHETKAVSANVVAASVAVSAADLVNNDGAYSSSSEGFCESDPRRDSLVKMDSDSDTEVSQGVRKFNSHARNLDKTVLEVVKDGSSNSSVVAKPKVGPGTKPETVLAAVQASLSGESKPQGGGQLAASVSAAAEGESQGHKPKAHGHQVKEPESDAALLLGAIAGKSSQDTAPPLVCDPLSAAGGACPPAAANQAPVVVAVGGDEAAAGPKGDVSESQHSSDEYQVNRNQVTSYMMLAAFMRNVYCNMFHKWILGGWNVPLVQRVMVICN